jgi:DNA helicase-2/ATP-dependent DNA helicase PcrA
MLQADRSAESAGRLENLAELTRAMEEYETLGAFLEHVSLVMENDAERDTDEGHHHDHPRRQGPRIRDWSSSPAGRKASSPPSAALDEGGQASLEEERRLAYVGDHAGEAQMLHLPRRQPPHLRPVDELNPLALHRRAAGCPHPAGADDVRRGEPVARELVGAGGPLRGRGERLGARPGLAKGGDGRLRAHPEPRVMEARASAVSLGNPGGAT